MAPVLEEIAAEQAGKLTVAKLDVDANPETARNFQVVSIPTLILFKDGQPVKRIVGAKARPRCCASFPTWLPARSNTVRPAGSRQYWPGVFSNPRSVCDNTA
ncbi:thioredoxin [Mycobacterium xenopi 3993]|nr:thioredoxin [Mycobacterium xenopi 3993]